MSAFSLSKILFSGIIFILFTPFGISQERIKITLQDNWFFLNNHRSDSIPSSELEWKKVTIPHTWNALDIQSGEKVNYGTCWYKRKLKIDNALDNQFFIRFEGVGQYARVYINGKYVGEHLGSYSAFCFNITEFLHEEVTNDLYVMVNNELNNSYPPNNFLFGIFGGIYRDVTLIQTNPVHIALCDNASPGVFIQTKGDKSLSELQIRTQLKNEGEHSYNITLKQSLFHRDGQLENENISTASVSPGGLNFFYNEMSIPNPRLWNGKKDPYLYTLRTEVWSEGKLLDATEQKTGIRYINIDPHKGFILNGEPYRLYGVCRHQEWEDFGNALLPSHHRKDMELISEIGATSIRLAHYQQSEYIYDLADSLGILIWAEIPFVNVYKEGADGNAKQQLRELILQNYNHASIFVWGLHNEVVQGGVIRPPANLTIDLHNLAKWLDPGRYTVAVSNTWWIKDNAIHGLADLQGFNQYSGWYGGSASDLKGWIETFTKNQNDHPFSISEYGAGGNVEHQSNDNISPPDPMGQFFPEAYQTQYHETTWTAIEEYPNIWASYVWNMFDFAVPEWNRGDIKGRNHKGLITYDRKTKKDAFYWYKANWSDEPVLHIIGKRNNSLSSNSYTLSIYCNAIENPTILINGKSQAINNSGTYPKYVFENIKLQAGANDIEVSAKFGKNWITDNVKINLEEN